MVEEQQSEACLRARWHPLVTTAVHQGPPEGLGRRWDLLQSAQGTSSPRLLKAVSTSDPWLTESGDSPGALAPSFSAQSRQLAALWLC